MVATGQLRRSGLNLKDLQKIADKLDVPVESLNKENRPLLEEYLAKKAK